MLIPVILCGGSGSRLWPVSREMHPKPFIRITNGNSLLQEAYLHAAMMEGVCEIMTVTNQALFFKAQEECESILNHQFQTSYILEPMARNTAAAIAVACFDIQKRYGDEAKVLVLSADHVIKSDSLLKALVSQACDLASHRKLVTLGIQPTSPHTGYGYIHAVEGKVKGFYEKPEFELAKQYFESGEFYWNSGIFIFNVSTLLNELDEHASEIYSSVFDCFQHSLFTQNDKMRMLSLDPVRFSSVPEGSIDCCVLEKSQHIDMIPAPIIWSDVGSWASMSELLPSDENGNQVQAKSMLQDVKNCYIQSADRLIACLGLRNLVVVDTPDALLIADRDRSQDVKNLYEKLKIGNDELHKLHRTVHRPWGSYTLLQEAPSFKIKRLEVKPGASLSLQKHEHRSEHWIVVLGAATVQNDEKVYIVSENESTYISAKTKHRLSNRTRFPLVIIEIQCGSYLGEDDIVRFDDEYGRKESA